MILVTGAGGRLGGRVARLLADQGQEVVGTDQREAPEGFEPNYVVADLCDRKKVSELVADADSVIHMGAIPGPGGDPEETFDNNMLSTFNVMWAAQRHKVRRVVFSSSAFGMGWARDPAAFVPNYLPLDEDHPMMPFEPYGLTKQLGECIGAMVARSSSTSVVSLRFTNVVHPDGWKEFPLDAPTPANPRTLVMWAYADPRDVAEAHIRSLNVEVDGHESFMIAQPTTRFAEPTIELVKANFGESVEIREGLEGNASVISTKKIERVMGFRPSWDWREGIEDRSTSAKATEDR
jgi:nucleoside-diphosphate-sugar epimerase